MKKKEMYISKTELNQLLPWSKNVVDRMITAGIFKPIRNPLVISRKSKMFFWKPQVQEAIDSMVGTSVHI